MLRLVLGVILPTAAEEAAEEEEEEAAEEVVVVFVTVVERVMSASSCHERPNWRERSK